MTIIIVDQLAIILKYYLFIMEWLFLVDFCSFLLNFLVLDFLQANVSKLKVQFIKAYESVTLDTHYFPIAYFIGTGAYIFRKLLILWKLLVLDKNLILIDAKLNFGNNEQNGSFYLITYWSLVNCAIIFKNPV